MGTKLKVWFKQWNELKHRKHISILILAIIAIGVLALYSDYLGNIFNEFWKWVTIDNGGKNSAEAISATLRNLALAVFGSVGLGLATWRSIVASQNTKIANRNSLIAEQNRLIAESNSAADAFTRAIEQLGSGSDDKPNMGVRLGAIYTLELLSKKNNDYYQSIIDILASYVRQNAPIPPISKIRPSDKTRIDVQTAMTVICRREVKLAEPRINLSQTYLPSVTLDGGNLQNANLSGANLQSAILYDTALNDSYLFDAELSSANLQGAVLQGAILNNANLNDASLFGADLQRASLSRAVFVHTNLQEANLQDAYLAGAKGLNCKQLEKAKNWQSTHRDDALECGAEIPIPF